MVYAITLVRELIILYKQRTCTTTKDEKMKINVNEKKLPVIIIVFCCALTLAFFHYHKTAFEDDISKCAVFSFLTTIGLIDAVLINLLILTSLKISISIEKIYLKLICIFDSSYLRGPPLSIF